MAGKPPKRTDSASGKGPGSSKNVRARTAQEIRMQQLELENARLRRVLLQLSRKPGRPH